MSWKGNPAFKDVDDAGSRWMKSHWKAEVKNGRTMLSFRAWCREQGFFVSGNPTPWDDIRRVSLTPLSSVGVIVGEGGGPGSIREPELHPIVPVDGPRRRISRRRRRAQLPPSVKLDRNDG